MTPYKLNITSRFINFDKQNNPTKTFCIETLHPTSDARWVITRFPISPEERSSILTLPNSVSCVGLRVLDLSQDKAKPSRKLDCIDVIKRPNGTPTLYVISQLKTDGTLSTQFTNSIPMARWLQESL